MNVKTSRPAATCAAAHLACSPHVPLAAGGRFQCHILTNARPQEKKQLEDDPLDNATAGPDDETDMMKWTAMIMGPENSP